MKIRQFELPKNESQEHFILKNVAMAYLRLHFGCTIAAMEVPGMHIGGSISDDKEAKLIADSVGIRINHQWLPILEREENGSPYKRIETVYCIEAKVSRGDFKSGYCIGGDLNYVIVPNGLVKKEEVYKGVGLIEVDMEKLEFTNGWDLIGLKISKRATNRKQLQDDPVSRDKWIDGIFRDMARQLTLNSIKTNPWVYPGWRNNDIVYM